MFDLYPAEARDPLLALIREKEQAEREAATAVRDALGEFIGRVESRRRSASGGVCAGADARAQATVAANAVRKVDRLIVVALDPGHGGEDPGAIGPADCAKRTWCWRWRCNCATASMPNPACAPC